MLYVTILALMMTACSAPSLTSQTPTPMPVPTATAAAPLSEDYYISQVKEGANTVDGDLADWVDRAWFGVRTFFSGRTQQPSADLDVRASFAFDTDKFYLAVRAVDDDIQTVDRSFRYGDGFFFTLVAEEGKQSSTYVYQFAFDQQTKVLFSRMPSISRPSVTRTSNSSSGSTATGWTMRSPSRSSSSHPSTHSSTIKWRST